MRKHLLTIFMLLTGCDHRPHGRITLSYTDGLIGVFIGQYRWMLPLGTVNDAKTGEILVFGCPTRFSEGDMISLEFNDKRITCKNETTKDFGTNK